jgi:electron transfer flavoprotein alpha subunit
MTEQKNKIGPVWVIAEQIDCRLLAVSTQLLGQARKLADELHTSVQTILLGDDIERQTQALISAGADRVYLGDAPELAFYHPETYTEIIVNLAQAHKPEIILLSAQTGNHPPRIDCHGQGIGTPGSGQIKNRFDRPLH